MKYHTFAAEMVWSGGGYATWIAAERTANAPCFCC